MTVKDVIELSEFKKLTDKGLAVVKYSASWCGPCKRIHPTYVEYSKKHKNINFLHVDVDEASDTLPNQMADVSGLPTFHFMKDGKVVDKLEGANLTQLKNKFEKFTTSSSSSEDKASTSGASGSDEKDEKASERVIEVSTAEEYKKYTSAGKAIVDFSATWCGPCKNIAPIFKILSKDYKSINFLKIDIDEVDEELDEIINNERIVAVPSFLTYHDNKIIGRVSGGNLFLIKQELEKLSHLESENKTDEKNDSSSDKEKNSDLNKEEKVEDQVEKLADLSDSKTEQETENKKDEPLVEPSKESDNSSKNEQEGDKNLSEEKMQLETDTKHEETKEKADNEEEKNDEANEENETNNQAKKKKENENLETENLEKTPESQTDATPNISTETELKSN